MKPNEIRRALRLHGVLNYCVANSKIPVPSLNPSPPEPTTAIGIVFGRPASLVISTFFLTLVLKCRFCSSILLAPRLPANPLPRFECINTFVCSLRALQAPCLVCTLGGIPNPEPQRQPGPRDHPPRDAHPRPRSTPFYSECKATPSGGHSKWIFIPSVWLFRRVHFKTRILFVGPLAHGRFKSLIFSLFCFLASCFMICSCVS